MMKTLHMISYKCLHLQFWANYLERIQEDCIGPARARERDGVSSGHGGRRRGHNDKEKLVDSHWSVLDKMAYP